MLHSQFISHPAELSLLHLNDYSGLSLGSWAAWSFAESVEDARREESVMQGYAGQESRGRLATADRWRNLTVGEGTLLLGGDIITCS